MFLFKMNIHVLGFRLCGRMLRLVGIRRISISSSRLIQRERIDKTPEKQKPKPRFQNAPGMDSNRSSSD